MSKKVILKYVLIQLAELVLVVGVLVLLVHLVDMAVWLAVVVVALWLVKDVALFPKVWKAYAVDENSPLRSLLGSEAIVMYGLDPDGYVRVNGELWRAECTDKTRPAKGGDRVVVVEVRGMTLMVAARDDGPEAG